VLEVACGATLRGGDFPLWLRFGGTRATPKKGACFFGGSLIGKKYYMTAVAFGKRRGREYKEQTNFKKGCQRDGG